MVSVAAWFAPQRAGNGPRALARRSGRPALSLAVIACRLLAGTGAGGAFSWRRKLDSRSTRFRKTDGYRLLGRPRAVLPLPDVLDLRVNELSRLCRRRFALSPIFAGPSDGSRFWHGGSPVLH
jgi:hypothetical protein